MPALESASNTADNIRFCVEDIMKYKKAAEIPEPTKLTTKLKQKLIIIIPYIKLMIK